MKYVWPSSCVKYPYKINIISELKIQMLMYTMTPNRHRCSNTDIFVKVTENQVRSCTTVLPHAGIQLLLQHISLDMPISLVG